MPARAGYDRATLPPCTRLAILKTENMPIYEYRCADCEARFEDLVATSAQRDEAQCPSCEGRNTQRLLSTFAGHTGAGAAGSGSSGSAGTSGSAHSCGSPNCCRVR
jgi:putative FmdB family regulatory protein